MGNPASNSTVTSVAKEFAMSEIEDDEYFNCQHKGCSKSFGEAADLVTHVVQDHTSDDAPVPRQKRRSK
jgi:hypothetical protein